MQSSLYLLIFKFFKNPLFFTRNSLYKKAPAKVAAMQTQNKLKYNMYKMI